MYCLQHILQRHAVPVRGDCLAHRMQSLTSRLMAVVRAPDTRCLGPPFDREQLAEGPRLRRPGCAATGKQYQHTAGHCHITAAFERASLAALEVQIAMFALLVRIGERQGRTKPLEETMQLMRAQLSAPLVLEDRQSAGRGGQAAAGSPPRGCTCRQSDPVSHSAEIARQERTSFRFDQW